MIALLLALAALAQDPGTELLRQHQAVEAAATAVADARADGARRSKVADLMRTYREAAAALEALEQARAPSLEEVRRTRSAAVAELTRALAEGDRESGARDTLATWLGDPSARVALLEGAVAAGEQAPAEIRRGVLLDVVDQADALVALVSFDAVALERQADMLELRALSLRRAGPGQTASMADEVEALRLDEQARAADAAEEALIALRSTVQAVRARAVAALVEDG